MKEVIPPWETLNKYSLPTDNETIVNEFKIIFFFSSDGLVGIFAVSSDCNHLATFDGVESTQSKTAYASFSKQTTFTLHSHSVPPIEKGIQFLYLGLYLYSNGSKTPKINKSFQIHIQPQDFQLIHFPIVTMLTLFIGIVLTLTYHHFLNQTKEGKHSFTTIKGVVAGWFSEEDKNYAYITLIFAIVFFIPGFQYVLENYSLMKTTGNRDLCYFNEKCYIPLHWSVKLVSQ